MPGELGRTIARNAKLPPAITRDFTATLSSSRCAEPVKLRGTKLKQLNPETLCLDPETTVQPSEDPSQPTDPRPIRTKADATMTCHTYVYPEVRMDCSSRGKFVHDRHGQICRAQRQTQSWQEIHI